MPATMSVFPAGTSVFTAIVPIMYIPTMTMAESAIARGKSRCGFFVRPATIGATSKPANANIIEERKTIVSHLVKSGIQLAAVM